MGFWAVWLTVAAPGQAGAAPAVPAGALHAGGPDVAAPACPVTTPCGGGVWIVAAVGCVLGLLAWGWGGFRRSCGVAGNRPPSAADFQRSGGGRVAVRGTEMEDKQ